MSRYIGVALFSVMLSSLAQILLKKAADKKKRHWMLDYLNVRVICAYAIIFICMFLAIYAFTGMYYRLGAVIESLSFLLIMVFGRIFLGEKITRRRLIGNGLIVLGVIIFSFGI